MKLGIIQFSMQIPLHLNRFLICPGTAPSGSSTFFRPLTRPPPSLTIYPVPAASCREAKVPLSHLLSAPISSGPPEMHTPPEPFFPARKKYATGAALHSPPPPASWIYTAPAAPYPYWYLPGCHVAAYC